MGVEAFNYYRSAALKPRWIGYGDHAPLHQHLRFLSPLHNALNTFTLRLARCQPIDDHRLAEALGGIITAFPNLKNALLYYSGDYKDTVFVGVIETPQEKYIVKWHTHYNPPNITPKALENSDFSCVDGWQIDTHLECCELINAPLVRDNDPELATAIIKACLSRFLTCPTGELPLAHGDLNRQNILDLDGHYALIDFEQIGYYPPFFDWFHFRLKARLLAPHRTRRLALSSLLTPLITTAQASVAASTPQYCQSALSSGGISRHLPQDSTPQSPPTLAQTYAWLIEYLKYQRLASIERLANTADTRHHERARYIEHLVKRISAPSILAVHQGHDLYGSGKVFLATLGAWSTLIPQATFHVDLPANGALAAQLSPNWKVHYGRTWIARKYLFKQGLKCGLRGFGKSLHRAINDLRTHDLVYVNTITPVTYLLAALLTRKPITLHVHEIPSPLIRLVYSIMFAVAPIRIIFVSKAAQRAYPLAPWVKHDVIHNALNTSVLPKQRKRRSKDTFNLLAIGRINPQKGWLVLVKALRRAETLGATDLTVRFVGDTYANQDAMRDELVNATAILEHINVEFADFSANPSPHYEWADVVVAPSLVRESFGLVVIEAMAHGALVIVSDRGALPELVGSDAGIIVPAGNEIALAGAIIKAQNDELLRARLTRNAHARAHAYYQPKRYAHEICQILLNRLSI